ncbi:MAG TPA: ATP-binding protein [Geobacteraceae bacterium]
MDWECCWNKAIVSPEDCPCIDEGEENLYTLQGRRMVEKCLDCPRFNEDMRAIQESGSPLAGLLSIVIGELREKRAQLQSMDGFLNSKTREIKFLHELSLVLQTSMDLDEVLSVALTAITAGKGFGMNRAFLLMTDKERQNLKGYLGIGPRNYEEAWRIWQEIDQNKASLTAMARNFLQNKLTAERAKFQDILEKISVPLGDHEHIFNRALQERKAILVTDAFHNPEVSPDLAHLLGVDTFLVMPLISRNRRIGVIVADNCVTHKPITIQDMQSLETFAFPVAFALERASLYERVQEDVDKLVVANRKLKEQQELIVKMEKMALVGRITSSIAHSIRNPLLVIGGFARSLLRDIAQDDPKREYLESIVAEAKQLEAVLDEVLNYSDTLYPARDNWDVNQLVSAVCREMQGSLVQHRISSSFEPTQETPMAYIDYKQIALCLRSFLANSIEAVGDGGEIRIRTRLEGDDIVVEIADNAGDVSPEAREALATPFPVTEELGSGVGLPLCRSILARQGLSFAMESGPAGWTRYLLKLPSRKEDI